MTHFHLRPLSVQVLSDFGFTLNHKHLFLRCKVKVAISDFGEDAEDSELFNSFKSLNQTQTSIFGESCKDHSRTKNCMKGGNERKVC